MMTRKHYKAIASILNKHSVDYAVINDFCQFLGEDNPRFDRNRFIDACVDADLTYVKVKP